MDLIWIPPEDQSSIQFKKILEAST